MTRRPSLKAMDRRPVAAAETPAHAVEPAPAPERPTYKQPGRTGKKVVSVYLPETVWRDAKILAARTDSTVDSLMRRGLDLVFAEHGVNRGAGDA